MPEYVRIAPNGDVIEKIGALETLDTLKRDVKTTKPVLVLITETVRPEFDRSTQKLVGPAYELKEDGAREIFTVENLSGAELTSAKRQVALVTLAQTDMRMLRVVEEVYDVARGAAPDISAEAKAVIAQRQAARKDI